MKTRRTFLKNTIMGSALVGLSPLKGLSKDLKKEEIVNCDATTQDFYGQGPFYSENPPLIEDNLLADTDEPGQRMIISGRILNLDCNQYISNALVDVWHANDEGQYDNDGYTLRGFTRTNNQYIRDMYGLAPEGPGVDDSGTINEKAEREFFGRKCLVARRLLERGVRFIQVWSGNDNGFPRRNWDSHGDVKRDHAPLALGMSRGAAALIKDLKQRGMLDDTIVLWTTEFGRMPCSQGSKGRDHNPFVFTNWLCGGGIKGGTYGESDEWGYKPLDRANPTLVYDIHATILHQLGIDHEQLTVRHNGIDRRLTDVHGHVIREMLA